jgi:hypothetical protein
VVHIEKPRAEIDGTALVGCCAAVKKTAFHQHVATIRDPHGSSVACGVAVPNGDVVQGLAARDERPEGATICAERETHSVRAQADSATIYPE